MVAKLTRPAVAGQHLDPPAMQQAVQAESQHVVRPTSWGQRPAAQAPETQQERIQHEISQPAAAEQPEQPVRGAFGRRPEPANEALQETSNGVRMDGPVPEPRTRKPRTPAPTPEAATPFNPAAVIATRVELLKVAFSDPSLELDEGIAIADELWKWVVANPFA